ncbi:MAG: HlyD family efflux transporter periplasmic adaptor subunit [Burkholderiaceae bacterium]|nr:HlyD family efflux transporter periplasmic adaptor subunit [Burkholderiaceae bacterium]
MPDSSPSEQLLVKLLSLAQQARRCKDRAELGFLAVNDTHVLTPYRQAALWFSDVGVAALSGVVQTEANVPYVQWLNRVCAALPTNRAEARQVTAADLSTADAAEWSEWLPASCLMLPLPDGTGALLLARDAVWCAGEIALLNEWIETWFHAWRAFQRTTPWALLRCSNESTATAVEASRIVWWRQTRFRWAAAAVLALFIPVRLSVLAPGELVPTDPSLVSAPLDGVVASFAVQPNETVKAGQLLFSLDDATLQSRLEVARQVLTTAEAEYRQAEQLAVLDAKYKAQLSILSGRIEERRAEADYLQGQLQRSRVVAPSDGIVLFDDPSEWLGRPVVTGERIMRIAAPSDVEIEAWLPVGDAIPLIDQAPVRLYLSASPLAPVTAKLRYLAYDAVERPDGNYAYRVRARVDGGTDQRVGLKGTVKLTGGQVPVVYWVLRRPLAVARQFFGW